MNLKAFTAYDECNRAVYESFNTVSAIWSRLMHATEYLYAMETH